MRRRSLVRVAATFVVALVAAPSHARTAPQACAPGAFAFDAAAAAAIGRMVGSPVSHLEIGPAGEVRLGPCAAAGKIKAKRKATTIGARWNTCGTALRLKLAGKQRAPDCAAVTGRLRAKKTKKVKFTALRAPSTTTTSTTSPGGTTTTTPLPPPPPSCGNGIVDPIEQCEGAAGCPSGSRCTASCACEPVPAPPSTSQSLVAAALARGQIDLPTSLVYRAWALFADGRLPPEYDGEAWQGEDTALFLDVSRAWDGLDTATQAALQPFLLRPTEPGSYWHPPAGFAAAAIEDGSVECPFPDGGDRPDWRSTETAHFVVWSCGDNQPGDVDFDKRQTAAAVAEEVWAAMVPETGAPKPDSFPSFPLDSRIDVYLVKPHLCKRRQDSCAPLPLGVDSTKPVLAAVAGAPPCGPGADGALTSSGYMILDRERVAPAPPAGPWPFRYTFAHEFFHLIENARNLQAQGGTCQGQAPQENVTSWLVEASAEWAAWAYFPADGPDEREELFRRFQQRPGSSISLRSLVGLHPYQAFLYPFFVQQEKNGSRTAFLELWKNNGGVRNALQLDDRLDSLLPLVEHFRDFAVRNLNTTAAELPGDPLPLAERHQAQDTAIPENVKPVVVEPPVVLADAPAEIQRAASMQPLTGQYERYTVGAGVRHVKVDLQELANSGFVHADVVANVAGTWERRRLPGLVFEFCRDDPGDDIGEFYLVLSHHDRRPGSSVSGNYQVRTRPTCPSGWSGSIRYVLEQHEHVEETPVSGLEIEDDYEREEQVWNVVGTTPTGEPPLDQVELLWRGRYQQLDTFVKSLTDPCLGQTIQSQVVSAGAGSATDRVVMTVNDEGRYQPNPAIEIPLPQIEGTRTSSFRNCNGPSGENTQPLGVRPDMLASVIIGTAGLALLEPDPNDPNRFRGTTEWFDIQEPRPGGFYRLSVTVSWDLRRR